MGMDDQERGSALSQSRVAATGIGHRRPAFISRKGAFQPEPTFANRLVPSGRWSKSFQRPGGHYQQGLASTEQKREAVALDWGVEPTGYRHTRVPERTSQIICPHHRARGRTPRHEKGEPGW